MKIWSIIKAEYLINENAAKNWLFLIMLLIMGVSIINLSHQADAKVKKIVKLNKEVKALRSEYVELKTKVIKKRMASRVIQKMTAKGFVSPKVQPIKIKLETKK